MRSVRLPHERTGHERITARGDTRLPRRIRAALGVQRNAEAHGATIGHFGRAGTARRPEPESEPQVFRAALDHGRYWGGVANDTRCLLGFGLLLVGCSPFPPASDGWAPSDESSGSPEGESTGDDASSSGAKEDPASTGTESPSDTTSTQDMTSSGPYLGTTDATNTSSAVETTSTSTTTTATTGADTSDDGIVDGSSEGADTTTDPSECGGGSEARFELVGWATEAGGTTGGAGGTSVTVATGAELQAALNEHRDSTTPLTVWVTGPVTPENSSDSKIDVKDVSNVSILGSGAGAEFDGIGIKITRASNIVLRNLRIHHVDIGDKDAISIEGPADHIWVDHCELYATYEGVDKDTYDGLLDAKGEAEYITYSWNYLHDSWKTALVGSSDDDDFDRKITMHHNFFENCNSRLPLFRFGNGHVFNNLYEDIADTGINSRMGACLRVESNVFVRARNPWLSAYSDELGGAELMCNLLDDASAFDLSSDDTHEILTCTAEVPYAYANVMTDVAGVADLVRTHAGVGKLDDPSAF